MARIRTIKPEAFVSESLAAVSLTAERTFLGLLTQADDQGRHRDHAAIIAGQLWVLRPEHTPSDVETDLAQLADAGLVCRYKGPDDKRYLHIVTWQQHQKINRPSKSRLPECPRHDAPLGTVPSIATPAGRGSFAEPSPMAHGVLHEDSREIREAAPHSANEGDTAGQRRFTEPSVREQGRLTADPVSPHGPDLGPRTMDLGNTPSGGASAPAPDTVSAQQLAALALNDPDRKRMAERALLYCLADPAQLDQLTNRGLCHGIAGLLRVVQRVTQDADEPRAFIGYLPQLSERFLAAEPPVEIGFLDGAVGSTLAFQDIQEGILPTSDWDACLLLT
ncbi:glycoside hydrolase family protein [Streptomyces ipomoeae]|uniref:Phage or prophage related protein n=1 Tax=Streptomyces ipomoeae 91-03 TaxID=698759 RepID=L1KX51_9ACTN|nr:lanthionine synthetase LanC family protein [Streptomyces ipomoeae]EKX65187.1 hypothetical protein STRIP9103_05237 [Streptomyces ipomoeae 91-03]MDX2692432.1 hypothetical protein [Streptomyces ipomoeae]MDX2838044.1 hypothetical protein [Streptomyces ipomoeae]